MIVFGMSDGLSNTSVLSSTFTQARITYLCEYCSILGIVWHFFYGPVDGITWLWYQYPDFKVGKDYQVVGDNED